MKEINLLPPSRRQQLRNETVVASLRKFVGTINAALITTTVVGVVAAIGLTIAAPLVEQQGSEQLAQVLTKYQGLQQLVVNQNRVLTQLHERSESRILWTDYVREIIPLLPSGVRINYLAGALDGNDGQSQLVLRGQAATRTTLVLLQNRLSDLPFVQQVLSPTSNLLERENVQYDLSLQLTRPNGE